MTKKLSIDLVIAIRDNKIDEVRSWLKTAPNDDDFFAVDDNGWTLLHHAADIGNREMVDEILNSNASKADTKAYINAQDRSEHIALHFAAEKGHVDVVNLLLDRGADINAASDIGITALHLAAQSGHAGVLILLLDRGADPKVLSLGGDTLWHFAVNTCAKDVHRQMQVVALLMAKGFNPGIKNDRGNTAFDIATPGMQTSIKDLQAQQDRAEAAEKALLAQPGLEPQQAREAKAPLMRFGFVLMLVMMASAGAYAYRKSLISRDESSTTYIDFLAESRRNVDDKSLGK